MNEIIVGDALELLKAQSSNSVPMILFSPPYNKKKGTQGKKNGLTGSKNKKWRTPDLENGYDSHDDAMEWEDYIQWQSDILVECWRVLAPNGAIYYQHKPILWGTEIRLPTMYASSELILRQVIIWARSGGMNSNPTHYMPTCEWICVYAKPDFRLKNQSASGVGDVWYIPQETNTWHPAPFPLALAVRALETVMPAWVLDPFMGSGTTAKAATKLGIPWLGFEISSVYAERAMKEVAEIKQQPALIPVKALQQGLEL